VPVTVHQSYLGTEAHAERHRGLAEEHGITSSSFIGRCKPRASSPGTIMLLTILYSVFTTVAKLGPPAITLLEFENWEVARVLEKRLSLERISQAVARERSEGLFLWCSLALLTTASGGCSSPARPDLWGCMGDHDPPGKGVGSLFRFGPSGFNVDSSRRRNSPSVSRRKAADRRV
jgi:hypothetical protein